MNQIMTYVYFTKLLQKLDIAGLIAFCQEVGLDGLDLTVRPGFPVTPENVATELPKAVKKLALLRTTIEAGYYGKAVARLSR